MMAAAVLLVWVFFAVIVGFVASDRGRSGIAFGLLSLLISPLLVFVVLMVMPDVKMAAEMEREREKAEERRAVDQRRVHEQQIEALKALGAGAPSAAASTADELVKLAGLLKDGVLTQPEFEEQKRRLLQAQAQ